MWKLFRELQACCSRQFFWSRSHTSSSIFASLVIISFLFGCSAFRIVNRRMTLEKRLWLTDKPLIAGLLGRSRYLGLFAWFFMYTYAAKRIRRLKSTRINQRNKFEGKFSWGRWIKLPELVGCTISFKNITHTTVKRVFTFEVFLLKSPVELDGPDRERRVVLGCSCCTYGCCQGRFLRQG